MQYCLMQIFCVIAYSNVCTEMFLLQVSLYSHLSFLLSPLFLDALLRRPQPADTPPLSQVSEAPPAVTGPTSASSIPSTSLQPVQSHLEIPDKYEHT